MAFEQPNPALYPPPSTLQPKRPVAAQAASSTDPVTMVGRIGATPSTARITQEAPTPGKTMPVSVPASAMRTGPTPLSQTQKRAATTTTTTTTTQDADDARAVEPGSGPVGAEPAAQQTATARREASSHPSE
ncbi:hypothetical protein F5B18DRAFT_595664 [Nemania serpens]|nr:hypothetical protein F5B18DRAFT_595664 [Nemania serpens]